MYPKSSGLIGIKVLDEFDLDGDGNELKAWPHVIKRSEPLQTRLTGSQVDLGAFEKNSEDAPESMPSDGACFLPDSTCATISPSDRSSLGGVHGDEGSVCSAVLCDFPKEPQACPDDLNGDDLVGNNDMLIVLLL